MKSIVAKDQDDNVLDIEKITMRSEGSKDGFECVLDVVGNVPKSVNEIIVELEDGMFRQVRYYNFRKRVDDTFYFRQVYWSSREG